MLNFSILAGSVAVQDSSIRLPDRKSRRQVFSRSGIFAVIADFVARLYFIILYVQKLHSYIIKRNTI